MKKVKKEYTKARKFSSRSETVQDAESKNATVMEAYPCSSMAEEYRVLAGAVMADNGIVI